MSERMDTYDRRPQGLDAYLSNYGWHFSKRMADFAARKFGNGVLHTPKAFADLAQKNTHILNAKGYDAYYLLSKLKRLYPDLSEGMIATLADGYLANEYDGAIFTRFFADCQANQEPIIWEDMI